MPWDGRSAPSATGDPLTLARRVRRDGADRRHRRRGLLHYAGRQRAPLSADDRARRPDRARARAAARSSSPATSSGCSPASTDHGAGSPAGRTRRLAPTDSRQRLVVEPGKMVRGYFYMPHRWELHRHAPAFSGAPSAADRPMTPSVSVVICTFNRARDAAARARGAACADAPARRSNSSSSTTIRPTAPPRCSRDSATHAPLTCLREPRQGLSFARNRGVAASRGEIVAFTDDDVECRARLDRRRFAASPRRGPTPTAFGGRVLPVWPEDAAGMADRVPWAPLALQDHGDANRLRRGEPRSAHRREPRAAPRRVRPRRAVSRPTCSASRTASDRPRTTSCRSRLYAADGRGLYVPRMLVLARVHAGSHASALTTAAGTRDTAVSSRVMRAPEFERSPLGRFWTCRRTCIAAVPRTRSRGRSPCSSRDGCRVRSTSCGCASSRASSATHHARLAPRPRAMTSGFRHDPSARRRSSSPATTMRAFSPRRSKAPLAQTAASRRGDRRRRRFDRPHSGCARSATDRRLIDRQNTAASRGAQRRAAAASGDVRRLSRRRRSAAARRRRPRGVALAVARPAMRDGLRALPDDGARRTAVADARPRRRRAAITTGAAADELHLDARRRRSSGAQAVVAAGGFGEGFDGAADYDLYLRLVAGTTVVMTTARSSQLSPARAHR